MAGEEGAGDEATAGEEDEEAVVGGPLAQADLTIGEGPAVGWDVLLLIIERKGEEREGRGRWERGLFGQVAEEGERWRGWET